MKNAKEMYMKETAYARTSHTFLFFIFVCRAARIQCLFDFPFRFFSSSLLRKWMADGGWKRFLFLIFIFLMCLDILQRNVVVVLQSLFIYNIIIYTLSAMLNAAVRAFIFISHTHTISITPTADQSRWHGYEKIAKFISFFLSLSQKSQWKN